jgi:hypothetical protein
MVPFVAEILMSAVSETEFELDEPGGTISLLADEGSWAATLTLGASTVTLAGPQRTFAEATTPHSVSHSTWVRILPTPFAGAIDLQWIDDALAANNAGVPDILALAMQYTHGAPPILNDNMQIAGEAAYGPTKDGKRQEGSDFNDYLGLTWNYAEGLTDFPEKRQFRCLDCSGFIRMIWGYRGSMAGFGYADAIPLCLGPSAERSAIPRRAHEIYESSPGVIVIENAGAGVDDHSLLGIGDLVFFDADQEDGPRLDHVGMYLGPDDGDNRRFISSRKTRNGPTLGDVAGVSILNGTGLYARSFRSARRL